jgi:hypothetical protein
VGIKNEKVVEREKEREKLARQVSEIMSYVYSRLSSEEIPYNLTVLPHIP